MSSLNDSQAEWLNAISSRIAAAYSADDSAGRRRIYEELLLDSKFTEGPTIGVVELAQLVDVKVRSRFGKKRPSPEELTAEIDSTLNLIEMCQWLLHIRQRKWQSSLREVCGIDTLNSASLPKDLAEENSTLSKKELEIKSFIFKRKYPLTFELGLAELNMRDDPVPNRYKRFAKFFAATMREWDWLCAPPQALNLFSGFPTVPHPTVGPIATDNKRVFQDEDEVWFWSWEERPHAAINEDELFKWLKMEPKWPDKETLWWVAKKWLKWSPIEEKKLNGRRRGFASGVSRRNIRDKNKKDP